LVGAGIVFLGCGGADAASTKSSLEPTVYGADDRIEAFETGMPEFADLARAVTVALMPRSRVIEGPGGVAIDAPSFGEAGMLCPGERFSEQPSAATCTGTLVADDLVLTAGHCLDAVPCTDLAVVRGYFYEAPGVLRALTSTDVATCREVVAKHVDLPRSARQLDYAWFRIDPPLGATHTPELVTEAEPVPPGSPVTSANHGAGLPLKLQENGRVTDAREATLDYFIANLDAFHGASGAPVFDTDQRVVGLLARGGMDLSLTDQDCFTALAEVDTVEAAAEQATYAFRAVSGLCEHGGAAPSSLCTHESPPSPGDGGGCTLAPTEKRSLWLLHVGALFWWAAARRIRRSVTSFGRWC
jgi:hypothetical protein